MLAQVRRREASRVGGKGLQLSWVYGPEIRGWQTFGIGEFARVGQGCVGVPWQGRQDYRGRHGEREISFVGIVRDGRCVARDRAVREGCGRHSPYTLMLL
jgi:hypothetical protein